MNRILLLLLFCALSCSEAPLIDQEVTARFNNPVSMVLIPGTNLGVVANANVNLDEIQGSLIAIDLDAKTLLPDTLTPIPSFVGRIYADATRNRLYVPSRNDDGLLIYDYFVPGPSGEAISFTPVDVTDPVEKEVPNGVQTDDNPFDLIFSSASLSGDQLLVSNSISGTVSVISADTLTPTDMYADDSDLLGIPLISAVNFENIEDEPGRGAARMTLTPDQKLAYVSSTVTSDIYVLDTRDLKVEAMLDLSTLSSTGGCRGMALSTTGKAYVAQRGLNGVVELDVSNVTENGIDYEVADTRVLNFYPTGKGVEYVLLSADEKKLFVSNQFENTVSVIDLTAQTVVSNTLVGNEPSDLILDSVRGVIYVLNFLSDDISILDSTSGALVGDIQ